jgi:hypothetical protein
MSVTTGTLPGVRIVDMPDLGTMSDTSSVVAEKAGSGRISALALRDYVMLSADARYATSGALAAETSARIAADLGFVPLTGGAVHNPGTFNATGMHDTLSVMVNGASSLTEFQWSHVGLTSSEAFAVGMVVPPTTTAYSANAIGAYVQNGSTIAAGATGTYSYVRNTVAGATSYALNLLATDQTNVGLGGVPSVVVGAEIDIGAFNLATYAIGFNMVGVFPNGTPALAVAYQVATLNPAPWQVGLEIADRSAVVAINIGTQQLTANSDSQPINFAARDNTNAVHLVGIEAQHAAAGADLLLNTPTGRVAMSRSLGVGEDVRVGKALYISTANVNDEFRMFGLDDIRVIEFTSDGWNLQFQQSSGFLTFFDPAGDAQFVSRLNGDFYVRGNVIAANVTALLDAVSELRARVETLERDAAARGPAA